MQIICQILEIQPQVLIKIKSIQRFDSRATMPVTYIIYFMLSIGKYIESLAPLLITKLGYYSMIFDPLWMKKYGVLLDMINESIKFSYGYCTYLKAPLLPILPKLKVIDTTSRVNHQNITLKQNL